MIDDLKTFCLLTLCSAIFIGPIFIYGKYDILVKISKDFVITTFKNLKRALVMIVNDFKSTYHLILYYNSLI
jgi:hypothetical protein